jgi:transcriptional regulator with XRE-family HTH domain
MGKVELGACLRAWRERVGQNAGYKLTLEAAALMVASEAERAGISSASRKVPRSHASLTRWERGNVSQSVEGLEIIAKVYGIRLRDISEMPPGESAKPPKSDSGSRARPVWSKQVQEVYRGPKGDWEVFGPDQSTFDPDLHARLTADEVGAALLAHK